MSDYNKVNSEWDSADLKTPEHDAMVLKLMDKEAVSRSFTKLLLSPDARDKYFIKVTKIETEHPVVSGQNKFIVGYIDLKIDVDVLKFENKKTVCWYVFFIEVKPHIDSFGNLVRQIQKYRNYENGLQSKWIVFTKECSEEISQALFSQNILVRTEEQFDLTSVLPVDNAV